MFALYFSTKQLHLIDMDQIPFCPKISTKPEYLNVQTFHPLKTTDFKTKINLVVVC